jgi:3-oxoacyl-[acyl-carrier-protein] synthase II
VKTARLASPPFDVSDIAAQIACSVPTDPAVEGAFIPDDWMEPKEQRKVDPFILFGVAAADMALKDAGWHPASDEDQIATGVMIGSGIGGLQGIVEAGYTLRDKGPRRISPFFIPGRLINLVSGHVSIRTNCAGRTTPSSPPVRPARMPLAMLPG